MKMKCLVASSLLFFLIGGPLSHAEGERGGGPGGAPPIHIRVTDVQSGASDVLDEPSGAFFDVRVDFGLIVTIRPESGTQNCFSVTNQIPDSIRVDVSGGLFSSPIQRTLPGLFREVFCPQQI